MKYRPSLPIGFQLGGLPPVQRPLHSDQGLELYLLERLADADLLLLQCSDFHRLREWWRVLGENRIAEVAFDSRDARACAIRVHGRRLGESEFGQMEASQWKPFLLSIAQLMESAVEHQLRPVPDVSLTWVADRPLGIIPICAMPAQVFSEADILCDVAALLLSNATGIDGNALPAMVERLRSWNRFVPSGLFEILVECLPQRAASGISTVDEFKRRVMGGPAKSVPRPGTTAAIGERQGLNKIAGMESLKQWLRQEIVGPLRDPEVYQKYRVGVPNGILFFGPPGCGKTYVARQLAEELGYFFQEIRPSDVGSPYIHGTVLRIRELFDIAVEKAPSVIFIDEFDAFVPSRAELSGFQQHKSEEVNEFLGTLEGCADRNVLVVAATNAPEKIDPAVRRTGRFDKMIYIQPPDPDARRAMLQFHLHGRPAAPGLDLIGIAAVLDGYAASDIRMIVDEAARLALAKEASISTEHLLAAFQRVPPSITKEDEERYSGFRGRGI